ncbi:MAG: geranylgeranylglyceryl/heptaprenylglyceryl phosphate synthase [Cytophagales bacterium]|nr:MAG: geranylgeranylglyceryl/heptaprenylglyceryl phosphate synthase [Cytophagales bacterium]
MTILEEIQRKKDNQKKQLWWLIDPDKFNESTLQDLLQNQLIQEIDVILVGGSLIVGGNLSQTIYTLKEQTQQPIVIFPGSNMHIDFKADALLFLSLISGRNADYLIGQHVVAAPILRKSPLEILPTGYILIDSGKQTTVSYISNTTPIPADKPELTVSTAMAGEMLGLKLIYADAGSGAQKSITPKTVSALRKNLSLPLIIGGGIRQAQTAQEIWQAGADVIVVGNAIEQNPTLLEELIKKKNQ